MLEDCLLNTPANTRWNWYAGAPVSNENDNVHVNKLLLAPFQTAEFPSWRLTNLKKNVAVLVLRRLLKQASAKIFSDYLNVQRKADEFERNLAASRWPFKQVSARAFLNVCLTETFNWRQNFATLRQQFYQDSEKGYLTLQLNADERQRNLAALDWMFKEASFKDVSSWLKPPIWRTWWSWSSLGSIETTIHIG